MRELMRLGRALWPLIVVPAGLVLMGRLGMGRYIPTVLPFAVALLVVPLLPLGIYAIGRLTGQRYRGIFADDQIVELAQRLARAKAACLELLEKPHGRNIKFRDDAAREQGNYFETSAHLRLYYTIDQEGKAFRHHISMSSGTGAFALAAGQHIAGYLSELIPVNLLRIASMWRGQSTVFQIDFALDEAQQRQFTETPIQIPELAALPQLRARALEAVRKIRVVGSGTLKDWRYLAPR